MLPCISFNPQLEYIYNKASNANKKQLELSP